MRRITVKDIHIGPQVTEITRYTHIQTDMLLLLYKEKKTVRDNHIALAVSEILHYTRHTYIMLLLNTLNEKADNGDTKMVEKCKYPLSRLVWGWISNH